MAHEYHMSGEDKVEIRIGATLASASRASWRAQRNYVAPSHAKSIALTETMFIIAITCKRMDLHEAVEKPCRPI
jgi:hypothetical protein